MQTAKSCLVTIAVLLAAAIAWSAPAGAQVDAPPPAPPEGAPPPAPPQGAPQQQMPAPAPPSLPDVPDVVATVDGEPIAGEEFESMFQQFAQAMQMQGQTASPSDVLDLLIGRKVLEAMVEEAGVTVSDEDVEARLDELREQLPSPDFLDQILAMQGMTIDELREDLRFDVQVQQYLEQIEISADEMQERYEELVDEGQLERGEEVDVAHILIQTDGEDEVEAAREEIEEARRRIVEEGEDFGDVARDVSQDPGSAEEGGVYEGVTRGMMVPEFDERAFEGEIGEVSEPFLSDFGWHILTVLDKQEGGTAELDDIEEQLLMSMRQQKLQERVEAAREEADIEIHIDLDEMDVEEPPAAPEAPAMPEGVF